VKNVLIVHDRRGLGKCKVGTLYSHEGLRVSRGR